MAYFGRYNTELTIANPINLSSDSVARVLGGYNKQQIKDILLQIKANGPNCVQTLGVHRLIGQLTKNPDPEVVVAALGCLGIAGPRGAAYEEGIVACLNSEFSEVRAAAVDTLGHLGPFISYPEAVLTCENDNEAAVRVKVCDAIAEMEATSFHKALNTLLEDSVLSVRSAALQALSALVASSQEMQSVYSSKIGDQLEAMLASDRTRFAALDIIAGMGANAPSECTSAVVAALADKDIFMRMSAVEATTVLADSVAKSKEGLLKIKDLLSSSSPGTRAAAASALAALGEQAVNCAQALAPLLKDDEEDTSGAAYVMGNGGRRPPPIMRKPKCAAVAALGKVAGAEYVGKISEALNDPNWEVRLSAAQALSVLGEKAKGEVSALLGSMEDDAFPVRAMTCFALGQIGEAEALPHLIEALDDPAFSVRLYAVQAVAEMGQAAEEHCHEVFKLIDDTATSVRAAAIKTLAKMGPAGQNYAGVVATMLDDQDSEIRMASCEALASMGDPGKTCIDRIEGLLGDPVPAVQNVAISVLETMGVLPAPFLKDFGKGPGVPNDSRPGILLPGEVNFEGLGVHYGNILARKEELEGSGKWVGDVV